MKREVALTVAAMILAAQLGSSVAAAEPSVEQLSRIADLLANNDLKALRSFLDVNPDLLEGDSRVAALLRRFVTETDELPVYLGYDFNDTLDELSGLAGVEEQGSSSGDDASGFDDVAPGAGADAGVDSIY